jgi:L-lactate utilization protein LutB
LVDERDIEEEREWFYRERAEIAVSNLQKRNMNAQYVSIRREALSVIMEMVHDGAKVVRGDSITLEQVGIITELKKHYARDLIDPFETNLNGTFLLERKVRLRLMKGAFTCDVFITGTNAVTLDGKLVDCNGLGNRVSAMLFGQEKAIVVTGANKIVKDVDETLERIHGKAAPTNARRHFTKHNMVEFGDLPCVFGGSCVNCRSDWRTCCYAVIIEGNMM